MNLSGLVVVVLKIEMSCLINYIKEAIRQCKEKINANLEYWD